MDPGVLALVGIFALAAIFALWNFSYRRSIERRLAALGFERCDAEAPALEATWRALTGLNASAWELRLTQCRRRGALYHFTVRERPTGRASDDTANPGLTSALLVAAAGVLAHAQQGQQGQQGSQPPTFRTHSLRPRRRHRQL